ncbi:hypothetical protein NHQ30_009610 [Ciborinia camelliae]|nr:hypothetical protein NHQ30_009610 [Ciborinia camelliae]
MSYGTGSGGGGGNKPPPGQGFQWPPTPGGPASGGFSYPPPPGGQGDQPTYPFLPPQAYQAPGGAGQGPAPDQGFSLPPQPSYQPPGGWRDAHPPWMASGQGGDQWGGAQGGWSGGDPFIAAGDDNPFEEAIQQYVSPWVTVADGERAVEPVANPWGLMGGVDAFAPVVQQPEVPQREVNWLGPQSDQIPLFQQFENDAMNWTGAAPPTFQEQRGRALPATGQAPPFSFNQFGQMQPEEPQKLFVNPLEYQYRHGTLEEQRPEAGQTYQPSYQPPPPGLGVGRTVWEQQGILRPTGAPISWKDTRALGPGEGEWDPAVIQMLETGDFSQIPDIESIDEGPRKPRETMVAWRNRIITTRKAIGVVNSDLRARPYTFPSTAKRAGDTPEQFKARLAARRKVKMLWERDKENHKNKMDHTHKMFDLEYATKYRAEKAARQYQNAKKRKTALLIARRVAERDNQPRPPTPELPEDSSDEDLPAMPPRDRTGVLGGSGPKPKRCLYCKHMRKTCSLVSGSPRPCERCRERGISCEITRDLEDSKAKPSGKKGKAQPETIQEEEEEEEDDEDEEPITAQQRASLLRKKRAQFNQRPKRYNTRGQARRRSASPEISSYSSNKTCKPCKDQSRPCDGERPCGTCKLNGTEDMCSSVSFLSKYREHDYPKPVDDEMDWESALGNIDDVVDIQWDNLVRTPQAAGDAIRNMNLGPMMNHSSTAIQDSMETGQRTSFFRQDFENRGYTAQPLQPVQGGPSYNRLATVVENDTSYNSLAPTDPAPESTAEPFGDVAYYGDRTFAGQGMDYDFTGVAPQYSVENPYEAGANLEDIFAELDRHQAGSALDIAAPLSDPDPDPSFKGMPLMDYRREWKQDKKGIQKSKHCDEPKGIPKGIHICFKSPAKHCDYLQHGVEGGEWYTCVPCHQEQNERVAWAQNNIIEYTKLYYCEDCAAEQRPRTRSVRSRAKSDFRKDYCLCTSQLRKSWLCDRHREEACDDVTERALTVKNWMVRRGYTKCNGCDKNPLGDKTDMWACCCCKEVVYT